MVRAGRWMCREEGHPAVDDGPIAVFYAARGRRWECDRSAFPECGPRGIVRTHDRQNTRAGYACGVWSGPSHLLYGAASSDHMRPPTMLAGAVHVGQPATKGVCSGHNEGSGAVGGSGSFRDTPKPRLNNRVPLARSKRHLCSGKYAPRKLRAGRCRGGGDAESGACARHTARSMAG